MSLSKIRLIAAVAAVFGGLVLGLSGEAFAGKGNGKDGGPGNGNGHGHGQGVGGGQGNAPTVDTTATDDPAVEQTETAHPSDLGSLNAAHASPNARASANPNSQPGKIAAYENGTGELEDAANKEVTQEVIDAVNALLGDDEEEAPTETPDEGTTPTDTVDEGTTPPPTPEPEPTNVTTVE